MGGQIECFSHPCLSRSKEKGRPPAYAQSQNGDDGEQGISGRCGLAHDGRANSAQRDQRKIRRVVQTRHQPPKAKGKILTLEKLQYFTQIPPRYFNPKAPIFVLSVSIISSLSFNFCLQSKIFSAFLKTPMLYLKSRVNQ